MLMADTFPAEAQARANNANPSKSVQASATSGFNHTRNVMVINPAVDDSNSSDSSEDRRRDRREDRRRDRREDQNDDQLDDDD